MEEGTIRLILLCLSVFILLTIWLHGKKQKKKLQGVECAETKHEKDDVNVVEIQKEEAQAISCASVAEAVAETSLAFEPEDTVASLQEHEQEQDQTIEENTSVEDIAFQPEAEVDIESEVKIPPDPIQEKPAVELSQKTVEKITEEKVDDKNGLNIFTSEEKECMDQMFSSRESKETDEEIPVPVTNPQEDHVEESVVTDEPTELQQPSVVDAPKNFILNAKHLANDLLSIYIVAPEGEAFGGYDLLQTVLSNGFVYGDMQVFHHFEGNGSARSGKKLYSLVSATEPGDFDLSKMGSFECKGLILFMNPKEHDNAEQVFDSMLTIADRLADELEGELRADQTKPLSDQVITSMREGLVTV